MQKVLLLALVLVLHSFFTGSSLFASNISASQKLKYEYKIETDLPVDEFSDVFFERLTEKHKWQKIESHIGTDETYTSTFRFKDENAHSWLCEVNIRKNRQETGKMDVEMIMDRRVES